MKENSLSGKKSLICDFSRSNQMSLRDQIIEILFLTCTPNSDLSSNISTMWGRAICNCQFLAKKSLYSVHLGAKNKIARYWILIRAGGSG